MLPKPLNIYLERPAAGSWRNVEEEGLGSRWSPSPVDVTAGLSEPMMRRMEREMKMPMPTSPRASSANEGMRARSLAAVVVVVATLAW